MHLKSWDMVYIVLIKITLLPSLKVNIRVANHVTKAYLWHNKLWYFYKDRIMRMINSNDIFELLTLWYLNILYITYFYRKKSFYTNFKDDYRFLIL